MRFNSETDFGLEGGFFGLNVGGDLRAGQNFVVRAFFGYNFSNYNGDFSATQTYGLHVRLNGKDPQRRAGSFYAISKYRGRRFEIRQKTPLDNPSRRTLHANQKNAGVIGRCNGALALSHEDMSSRQANARQTCCSNPLDGRWPNDGHVNA